MHSGTRKTLVCNCGQTMALDGARLGRALGSKAPVIHENLCRAGIAVFEEALSTGEDLLVACTQEAPLFAEIAAESDGETELRFVNIRENAAWCEAKTAPYAKIAALLTAAAVTPKAARLRTIKSDGLCLVYGHGQQALETAKRLSGRLSVTLLLTGTDDLLLPTVLGFPVIAGKIVRAAGGFGSFEITVNGYAPLLPSSQGQPEFIMPRDGARSDCSLILDMSGGTPLFPGHEHRDGYAHADPADPAAVMAAVFDLSDMAGEFEKPIYVDYDSDICAHARSQIIGCSKCLDNCPAGAITQAGDGVSIDAVICGGCGTCAAVCPTGAVTYSYPTTGDTISKLQSYLGAYARAGGKQAVPLIHDGEFGADLIGAMSRLGRGLPGHVLPFELHSATALGHVEMLAAFAAGAMHLVVLANPKHRDELAGLEVERELAEALLGGFGFGEASRISILAENDPDIVEAALYSLEPRDAVPAGEWQAVGGKREMAFTVFTKLAGTAKTDAGKTDALSFPLTAGAPYGHLEIDVTACTLCMSCVSACPASALFDNPDLPQLRLVEKACVQCGLCASTCPEGAITIRPRLNLAPAALSPEVLHEEEPFACIECGKLFATKSTIDHITAKLAGKHSMFQGEDRIKLIQMCDNCRVVAQVRSSDDPFASGTAKKIRTTEDYLEAREKGLDVDDYLIDD